MPVDFELTKRIKPEPITDRERECMESLDMTDYEIYCKKLELIGQEGRDLMMKMGISSMIQSGDLAVGIYTAGGDLATGWLGIHLHLVNGQLGIKYIIKYFTSDETVGINPGDMFYVNEALAGGIHNSDQLLLMPIFHDGELIAWASASGHETETGSIEPGGQSPSATSKYTDGMNLLPFKIGENYKLKKDLLDLMENMVRDARMQTLDVKARAAVCQLIGKRINDIAGKKGKEFVIGIFRKMIEETAEAAAKKIAALRDGTFRHHIFFDNMGHNKLGLARASVAVTKKGDRILIDFADTTPRIEEGNFNTRPHGIVGCVAIYLFQYFLWDLKANAGGFVPFDFSIPEGSFFDADPEDAVSKGIETGILSVIPVHVAMEKLYFNNPWGDTSIGPWGQLNSPVFAGLNQYYQMIVCYDQAMLNGNGMGARGNQDGLDVSGFNFTFTAECPDMEHIEMQYPLLMLFHNKFKQDCHGWGKYRGGRGVEACTIIHNVAQIFSLGIGAAGIKFPRGAGLFGGYMDSTLPFVRLRNNNLHELFESNQEKIPYSQEDLFSGSGVEGELTADELNLPMFIADNGELIYQFSHGGGGYGDVLERDPEAVCRDVKDGTTSDWVAKNIYKVAYDPDTYEPDIEETKRLREAEFKDRLQRAKPYDEFEKEWSAKRPPEDILQYFGVWPGIGLASEETSIKM